MNQFHDIIISNQMSLIIIIAGLILATLLNFYVDRLLNAPQRKREEAKKRLYQNVLEKFKGNINLTVDDVWSIGRGMGVARADSIEVLYMLMVEAKEQKHLDTIRQLLGNLNKKAPYEDLPDDVKPAVIRLSEICSEAKLESDKSLLIPIQRSLSEYKIMLGEHQKMKKQSRVSYIVGIFSFLVGIVALAIAFRGPTVADVRETVTSAIQEAQKQVINKETAPIGALKNTSLSDQPSD